MKTPETIEELRSWYRQNGFPPESETRFFIGRNIQERRAFGIYQQGNEFIVYKNKNDGSRSIRYRGQDEAHAVNELYLRLLQEVQNQRNHGHNVVPDLPAMRDHDHASTPKAVQPSGTAYSHQFDKPSKNKTSKKKSRKHTPLYFVIGALILLYLFRIISSIDFDCIISSIDFDKLTIGSGNHTQVDTAVREYRERMNGISKKDGYYTCGSQRLCVHNGSVYYWETVDPAQYRFLVRSEREIPEGGYVKLSLSAVPDWYSENALIIDLGDDTENAQYRFEKAERQITASHLQVVVYRFPEKVSSNEKNTTNDRTSRSDDDHIYDFGADVDSGWDSGDTDFDSDW